MALKIAIDLIHMPSQVRILRSEPLPDGVQMLLRIAAGDEEAQSAAVAWSGRSQDVVREAAAFFIEQILFAPNSDSYRVLGANQQASAGELRRNVALLLRWLHPDLDPSDKRSIYIGRVTAAWNDLKTSERRVAYDKTLQSSRERIRSRVRNGKPERHSTQFDKTARQRSRSAEPRGLDAISFLRRALSVLLQRPLVR